MALVSMDRVGGNQWLHALNHLHIIHFSPVFCGGSLVVPCVGKAQLDLRVRCCARH